jgi:hypothetical protein
MTKVYSLSPVFVIVIDTFLFRGKGDTQTIQDNVSYALSKYLLDFAKMIGRL